MIETFKEDQELQNPEFEELSNLKKEINESDEKEQKQNPYKEMIEKQKSPIMY
jgi:hypothetical protein